MTELVNTLVIVLGKNAANVTLVIPPEIPLTNVEDEEARPPQEGEDATASETRTDTDAHRRRAWCRRCNTRQGRPKNRETTPESHGTKKTRDSVFNRLERTMADPNLDDEYDSEYEHPAGSRERADQCARLDAQKARHEQLVENKPHVRAMPKEKCLSQIQVLVDRLLAERSIPETQSLFPTSISTTIPPKNFKISTIPL